MDVMEAAPCGPHQALRMELKGLTQAVREDFKPHFSPSTSCQGVQWQCHGFCSQCEVTEGRSRCTLGLNPALWPLPHSPAASPP